MTMFFLIQDSVIIKLNVFLNYKKIKIFTLLEVLKYSSEFGKFLVYEDFVQQQNYASILCLRTYYELDLIFSSLGLMP